MVTAAAQPGRPTTAAAVYLPATADRPAEPAPWLMSADDVLRLLRVESADPYKVLWRLRAKGWLRAVKVGQHVRYRLPDVLKLLERMQEEDER